MNSPLNHCRIYIDFQTINVWRLPLHYLSCITSTGIINYLHAKPQLHSNSNCIFTPLPSSAIFVHVLATTNRDSTTTLQSIPPQPPSFNLRQHSSPTVTIHTTALSYSSNNSVYCTHTSRFTPMLLIYSFCHRHKTNQNPPIKHTQASKIAIFTNF